MLTVILSWFLYAGPVLAVPASQTTLKEYVEKKLREQVIDTLIVEEVKK